MRFVIALILALLATGSARAQGDFGSRGEAVALVKRGIAHMAAAGPARALADFTVPSAAFVDRDLYLIVTDLDGTRLAHGQNARLVGQNIADATDIIGTPYGRDMVAEARRSGSGWMDYVFSDPVTRKLLPKSSYFERAGDYIFYCGVYRR